MNETISQEINQAMMKQVERAVRPIPVGKKRKLQMREELLAHLTGIYQEELSRQPSEPAALSAAFDRFGSPAEISAELADGVTWHQRLAYQEEEVSRLFDRCIVLRSEDSLFRYTSNVFKILVMIGAITLVLYGALLWLLEQTYDPLLLPLTLPLVAHSAISLLCFFWAIRGIDRVWFQAAGGFRWTATAATTLGWLFVFTALSFVFWYIVTGSLEESVARIPDFILTNMFFSMTGVFLTAWCFHNARQNNQPHEVWTRLEMEE
jgi:hypothetical protein